MKFPIRLQDVQDVEIQKPLLRDQLVFNGKAWQNLSSFGSGNSGSLSTSAPASGTIYQNTTGVPLTVLVPITYNPTGTVAATMTPALGPASPPGALPAESEPAALTVGRVRTYCLRIPVGWYYSFTVSNAVLGTAQIIQG